MATRLYSFEHPRSRAQLVAQLEGEVVRMAWLDAHTVVAFVVHSHRRLFLSCRLRFAVAALANHAVLVDVSGRAEPRPADLAHEAGRVLERFPGLEENGTVSSPDALYRAAFLDGGILVSSWEREIGFIPMELGASAECAEWVRGAPDESWLGGHGLILPGSWEILDLASLQTHRYLPQEGDPLFVQGSPDGMWLIANLGGETFGFDASR